MASVLATPTTRPPRQKRQSVKPPLEKDQVEPFIDYKLYFQQIPKKKVTGMKALPKLLDSFPSTAQVTPTVL